MTSVVPLPLAGIRVLDFSNLLPGPLASLLLAEAGAEVIKVERPDGGDEMRAYAPATSAAISRFSTVARPASAPTSRTLATGPTCLNSCARPTC